MVTRVAVEPAVLEWAQARSGRSRSDFHAKFGGWDSWTTGTEAPTLHQLEDVARFAHLPFGLFFLPEPPSITLPIPDYRNGPTAAGLQPSLDLLQVIEASLRRQDWYRDYLERTGAGTADLERRDSGDSPEDVARHELRRLDYTIEGRRRLTREQARNNLRRRFEALGGLSVFTSMVGNDNHRMLSRSEFRGFTLADDYAPFIFVNTRDDSLSGQIFTFLHEYAHVLRGKSGISDEDPSEEPAGEVERWCNNFAAEALVPADDLQEEFRGETSILELDRLSRRYLCSTLVILLRLRHTKAISSRGFEERFAEEKDRVEALSRMQPAREGGDFYANQPFRIGEKLSRSVLSDVRSGGTSYTDALRVLGLRSTDQMRKYSEHLGIA